MNLWAKCNVGIYQLMGECKIPEGCKSRGVAPMTSEPDANRFIADHTAAAAELRDAREALRKIEAMTTPLGYDSGHEGVLAIARAFFAGWPDKETE